MRFLALFLVVLVLFVSGLRLAGIETKIPELDRSVSALLNSAGLR